MKGNIILKTTLFAVVALMVSAVSLPLFSCRSTEKEQVLEQSVEPAIPSHFSTYTDEIGLFTISYPPDWLPVLSILEDAKMLIKELINSIESDLPTDNAGVIFFAGLPIETGYMPSVNIIVESLQFPIVTHETMVEAGIRGIRSVLQDFQELSRVNTTIDGRRATIIEYEGVYPTLGKGNCLVMLTLVGKTAWVVTCTAPLGELGSWRKDFTAVVRSLRILK